MKARTLVAMAVITLCVYLGLEAGLLGPSASNAANPVGTDPVGAKVVEIKGTAQAKTLGEDARVLKPGDAVLIGEELSLKAGSTIVLAMTDKTVRRFTGPTTIEIKENADDTGGSVLANLSSGVIDILFAKEEETTEAVMATRAASGGEEAETDLPVLVSPAPSSSILELPREFQWRRVEGVPLYRVSVYGSESLMWQGTTSASRIACPPDYCDFRPGQVYYWVVEALVGNSSIRSRAGEFRILDRQEQSAFHTAMRETDSSCSDQELAAAIKVRLCLASRLYNRALDTINLEYGEEQLNQSAYVLRAQVYEAMGLVEDAFQDYKHALSAPIMD